MLLKIQLLKKKLEEVSKLRRKSKSKTKAGKEKEKGKSKQKSKEKEIKIGGGKECKGQLNLKTDVIYHF